MKEQFRCKRKLIGRVDERTGEIVPTNERCRKDKEKSLAAKAKRRPVPATETKYLFYGAIYLLKTLADELGLTDDLRACFPEHISNYTIAFYLILDDNNPLYRFEKRHLTHKHPHGEDIISPKSSDLFAKITDEQVNNFFRLQGKRRVEDEYWEYDSTSISSYSETLSQIVFCKIFL